MEQVWGAMLGGICTRRLWREDLKIAIHSFFAELSYFDLAKGRWWRFECANSVCSVFVENLLPLRGKFASANLFACFVGKRLLRSENYSKCIYNVVTVGDRLPFGVS